MTYLRSSVNKMKILNIKYLLFVATILLFLNLTVYLPAVNIFPFPAYVFDIVLFLFLVFYYMKNKIILPLNNILLLWLLYYSLINIIYFILSSGGPEEYKYFKNIIFFIFFLSSMILLFNLDDENLTTTRKTLILVAIIATFCLGIEFMNPGYFVKSFGDITFMAGRASAFYLNANIAGGAMVLLLILTIDMVQKKYRLLYIVIIFLGVFFTLSRSNLLIFFLTVFLIILQRKIHRLYAILLPIIIIAFITWLANGGLNILANNFDFEITDNIENRINFFADTSKSDTGNLDERKMVLKVALDMFADNPFVGSGYAATRLWDYRVAPHNTFAMQWAEFGFFGFLIIPLIVILSTYNVLKYGERKDKQMAITFILYFIIACFFSHNIFEQPFRIAGLVIVSTLGYNKKKKFLSNINKEIKSNTND